MGWLQRRPQVSDSHSFYTIGFNKTVLLVGLGNPGKEYDLTRHNVGFYCIDEFVEGTDEMTNWVLKKDFKSMVSQGSLNGNRVIAIKPTTYMNLSGEAVKAVTGFYQIPPEQMLVIHDEADINFGQIRLRQGGSSGGHNGVKSVSQAMGETYDRLRIGIGPKKPDQIKLDDYVLQKFNKDEQKELPNLKKEVNSIISEFLYGGSLSHETRSFLV